MSARDFCRVERDGRLTIVTINRPDVMNALHPPANFELEAVFDDFAADSEQWVAIVTGAGDRAFSAGNDLKYAAMLAARGERGAIPRTGFGGLTARYDCAKPIIAAVNGLAMGGGFEIALACDLVVASEGAIFSLPEAKVGMAALAGGLHRLPREIGYKQAMHLILTGKRVDAAEGAHLGFVNEVVPAADVMDRARQLAGDILKCGPLAIRAAKETALKGFSERDVEAATANQRGYPAMAAMLGSADYVEGPRAFAEKREPRWQGR